MRVRSAGLGFGVLIAPVGVRVAMMVPRNEFGGASDIAWVQVNLLLVMVWLTANWAEATLVRWELEAEESRPVARAVSRSSSHEQNYKTIHK